MLSIELLVVEPEKIYERRGRVQRIVGIRRELYHHPDALSVPEHIFSFFVNAFRAAHQNFNYYGYTEYGAQDILRLSKELMANEARFSDDGNQSDAKIVAHQILALAEDALRKDQSLLVLGI
jgi:hypothetical protein